ncbi:MAG: alanine dehydrogenase [Cytophagales bacterium]|nr:alanine dehydrogenase [Cytophagales bacterium]
MNKKYKPTIEALAKQSALYPQEAVALLNKEKQSLVIGLPKEQQPQENRVCLTPESVGLLVANGHEVVVESEAGKRSGFKDIDYSEKGARIIHTANEVFECSLILKIDPPTIDELKLMKYGATLISALQMSQLSMEYLVALNKKRITGVAFELLEDKEGVNPVVRTISEITSLCVVSIISDLLSTTRSGMGAVFGGVTGVPPLNVLVLGAGTIGENVTRFAKNMGADVRVFDNHHYKLRRLKTRLGEQVYTSVIDTGTLRKELKYADVVIGALRSQDGRSICVVSEEMIMDMKENAIIVDVSISQGGCFETSSLTSHDVPTFKKHGIIHYCVPNISSRVAVTTSKALSNIFTPLLLQMQDLGGVVSMISESQGFGEGVYAYRGNITSSYVANKFGVQYKDLRLLLSCNY